jgi:hypothetical protein
MMPGDAKTASLRSIYGGKRVNEDALDETNNRQRNIVTKKEWFYRF